MEAEFDPKPLTMTLRHFLLLKSKFQANFVAMKDPLLQLCALIFLELQTYHRLQPFFPILKVLLSHPDLFDLLKA